MEVSPRVKNATTSRLKSAKVATGDSTGSKTPITRTLAGEKSLAPRLSPTSVDAFEMMLNHLFPILLPLRRLLRRLLRRRLRLRPRPQPQPPPPPPRLVLHRVLLVLPEEVVEELLHTYVLFVI